MWINWDIVHRAVDKSTQAPNVPGIAQWTEDGRFCSYTASVVARYGGVAYGTVLKEPLPANVPSTSRRAEDSSFGFTIAVVIARDRDIAILTEGEGTHAADIPSTIRGAEDGNIGITIAIEIGSVESYVCTLSRIEVEVQRASTN